MRDDAAQRGAAALDRREHRTAAATAAASSLTGAERPQSRRRLYETLGFTRYADTHADQLSGGIPSKLNLGLALLADPEVLLLDEPCARFDFDTYLRFWDLVAERRAAGRSVLIISHSVVDEHRFDRIVQLHEGTTHDRLPHYRTPESDTV